MKLKGKKELCGQSQDKDSLLRNRAFLDRSAETFACDAPLESELSRLKQKIADLERRVREEASAKHSDQFDEFFRTKDSGRDKNHIDELFQQLSSKIQSNGSRAQLMKRVISLEQANLVLRKREIELVKEVQEMQAKLSEQTNIRKQLEEASVPKSEYDRLLARYNDKLAQMDKPGRADKGRADRYHKTDDMRQFYSQIERSRERINQISERRVVRQCSSKEPAGKPEYRKQYEVQNQPRYERPTSPKTALREQSYKVREEQKKRKNKFVYSLRQSN